LSFVSVRIVDTSSYAHCRQSKDCLAYKQTAAFICAYAVRHYWATRLRRAFI